MIRELVEAAVEKNQSQLTWANEFVDSVMQELGDVFSAPYAYRLSVYDIGAHRRCTLHYVKDDVCEKTLVFGSGYPNFFIEAGGDVTRPSQADVPRAVAVALAPYWPKGE